jgi:uncharacterized protein YsxB (DUF464 family)
MITVTYHKGLNRVVVEGHAGFAEAGKDLVCASATILAYTLAAFVDAKEQEGKCWCTMCHFNEGEAFVSCKANEGNEGEIAVGFETIVRGFELLAEKFPDNVKYISLRA